MCDCTFDNMDSPLHRTLDYHRDQNMKELKSRFCSILLEKLSSIKGLVNVKVRYAEFSNFISIQYDIGVYRVKLNYDLYTKKCKGPPHTTFGTLCFPIDKEQMSMIYGEIETELSTRLLNVLEYCYDVSKMKGYGNQYGSDWSNLNDSKTLAIEEFRRLLEESKQYTAK